MALLENISSTEIFSNAVLASMSKLEQGQGFRFVVELDFPAWQNFFQVQEEAGGNAMNILLASWNKLDPRDRRALGICLIFLFSVVLYMGVLAPLGNMYEATVQEQVELKQEIQLNTPKAMVLPDREAKLRQVKNEYDSLKRQLDLVDRRDWSSSDIYNEIRDYASITGVVIKEMRPLSQKQNAFLSSQPMDVTFSGSFTAVEKFIYYLETSPQVLCFGNFIDREER